MARTKNSEERRAPTSSPTPTAILGLESTHASTTQTRRVLVKLLTEIPSLISKVWTKVMASKHKGKFIIVPIATIMEVVTIMNDMSYVSDNAEIARGNDIQRSLGRKRVSEESKKEGWKLIDIIP